jgi:hypothetical protein
MDASDQALVKTELLQGGKDEHKSTGTYSPVVVTKMGQTCLMK